MNDHSDLFKQIDTNTIILTPNRRLAATLHKLYQQYQIDLQHDCWPTPDILPISSWIQRMWDDISSTEFTSTPITLTATQENYLWETIITKAKESTLLLQASETADIAKSAWGLLKQWRVDFDHPSFKSTEDYSALYHWAAQFKEVCVTLNYHDTASMTDIVAAKIAENKVKVPPHLILVGFTEHSPQLKYFLSCCEINSASISNSDLYVKHNECRRISLTDNEEEILTMARWAKSIHEKDKSVSIGCVIPSLDKIRDRVMQIFSEVFAPQYQLRIDTQTSPFNISAGKNLLNYPIINTAIHLLELFKKNISTEALSYLLTSPFLGDAEVERIKRGHFENQLRKANINKIEIALSLEENENSKLPSIAKNCPRLANRIKRFLDLIEKNDKQQTYCQWANLFNNLLSVLGWPGERSVSSEEYQVIESWLNLMSEFISLDQVATPVNYHLALQTLKKLVTKTTFQPKTPEAPIQVLGILEAAALPFDYLWVAGMDDISWPPQPKPNPFIPKSLQRELNMPHATAERELIYCQEITNQFKQSATHVIFSHANKNDDIELQPSPLIRQFDEIYCENLQLADYLNPREIIYQSKKIALLSDEHAPAITSEEKPRGGVNVIKQQALCPFKSFAEWRLHAHEMETPLPGLRAKDRGSITHKILELLWNELQDHTGLVSYDNKELEDLIHRCIDTSFELIPNARSEYKHYISLEKQRLSKLIWDWLQIEKDRPYFKVLHNEIKTDIKLNQLNLSIRIDRIDELSDGNKIIIDYKTGKNNNINSWFGDRLEEPQLPLYSLLYASHTCGISFAQIAPGENTFKGISRYAQDIKGIKLLTDVKKAEVTSWDEQLKNWDQTLKKLSDDFCHGIATVDPKDSTQTCTWCALKPLCRINEELH